jgi:hypothetical protein
MEFSLPHQSSLQSQLFLRPLPHPRLQLLHVPLLILLALVLLVLLILVLQQELVASEKTEPQCQRVCHIL